MYRRPTTTTDQTPSPKQGFSTEAAPSERGSSCLLNLLSVPLVLSAWLLPGLYASADEVIVPVGRQGEQSVDRPPRGTNKAQVEAVYGEPEGREGPTGNPPIYVWEYPEYTVYFEGDKVIHTVLKHNR